MSMSSVCDVNTSQDPPDFSQCVTPDRPWLRFDVHQDWFMYDHTSRTHTPIGR